VFLRGADETLRLRWTPDDEDRSRAVPAGVYRLFGARVVRQAWMLSTTGAGPQLDLAAGETHTLGGPTTVQVRLGARRHRAGLGIQLGITHGQAGLSVYRDGRRILVPYRVLDAAGEELAAGHLEYG
jgi:hypothetical protein